jgi:hypothetical protein
MERTARFRNDPVHLPIAILYRDQWKSAHATETYRDVDCLECSICDLITSGISVDNDEIVEFGLKKEEVNRILGFDAF